MTREEIEQQRDLLKVYFPNESSERHAFNRICDLAVKGLKSTAKLADTYKLLDNAENRAKPEAPQGWQLVPVRPTPEMIVAGANVSPPCGAVEVMERYGEMLAALRKPQEDK